MKSALKLSRSGLVIVVLINSVFGKLQFSMYNEPDTKYFSEMSNCIYDIINKTYEGGTLVFFENEIRDSIGQQLLTSGIIATVNVCSKPPFGNEYKKIFILRPNTSDPEFTFYNSWIPNQGQASYYIILWPSNRFLYLRSQIETLHEIIWQSRMLMAVSIVSKVTGGYDIYTSFPYSEANCGNGRVVRKVDECTTTGFKNNVYLFPGTKKINNFHNCNIKGFHVNLPFLSKPFRLNHGTVDVSSGIMYVTEIVEKKFNLKITNEKQDIYREWSFHNKSSPEIIHNYLNSSVELVFGPFFSSINIKSEFYDFFFSAPYCIGWVVPLFTGKIPSFWNAYVMEFPLLGWCSLFVAIIIASMITIIGKLIEGNYSSFQDAVHEFLTMFFLLISIPARQQTNLISVNMVILQWSAWGLIIRCAYEAALGSVITLPVHIEQIKSHQELLDYNFRVAGNKYMYKMLQLMATNDNVFKSLANKFEIIPDAGSEEILYEIYKKRNLAVLQPNSYHTYKFGKKRSKPLAMVMRPCVLQSDTISLMLRKGSVLYQMFQDNYKRIVEAGLIEQWNSKISFGQIKPRQINLSKIRGIFLIYFIGLLLAFVVLMGEIIYFKLNKNII